MHHPGFTAAEHPGRLALRWALAGTVVLAVHGLVALGLLRSAMPFQDPGEPPAAVMVDLAPLAAAPPSEASTEDTTPGDDADTQPTETEEQPPQPPEPEPVPEEPPPEEPAEPPPEPLPDPVVELPEPAPTPDFAELVTPAQVAALDMLPPPPDVPTPEVMLPAPTPPQRPPELTPPEKPKTAAIQPTRKVERRPPPPQQRRTRGSLAPRENEAAAPVAPREGSAPVSGQTKMEWAGKVVAHLRRHMRYPDRARAGTVTGSAQVLLRLDAAGNVLGVRIAASSGSPILDAAIIDGARNASPVPSPPPAMMRQATLNVRVPINFTLR